MYVRRNEKGMQKDSTLENNQEIEIKDGITYRHVQTLVYLVPLLIY
jgi:hypothetical protein